MYSFVYIHRIFLLHFSNVSLGRSIGLDFAYLVLNLCNIIIEWRYYLEFRKISLFFA